VKQSPSLLLCWLVLLAGVVATACSFVFIRESTEPPVMLAAWRVLLAVGLLSPAYLMARRRHGDEPCGQVLRRSLLPGMVLSAHFVSWVIGARLSLGANATIIVNLVPLAMPLLLWMMYKDVLQRREWLATLLAVAGLGILAADNLRLSAGHLAGDAICLLSMFLLALYLALARRHSALPSIWLYVVPVYAVAGITSLAAAPVFGPVMPLLESHNILMVMALAAVSTVIGHSALNFAMQHMRGQTVGVMTLAQFIVAGIIAYMLYDEIPSLLFYPASALMMAGMVMVALNQRTVDALASRGDILQ
jgi:drug/metabolite transporter (DMT)-like permease